jgi:hypothetical protein
MLARTDAVERLLTLGLLEQTNPDTLRLHRLLVAYASQALHDDAALPAVELCIGVVGHEAMETGLPQALLPVLPHLRYLVQQAVGRKDELTAFLCNNLGLYLYKLGAY